MKGYLYVAVRETRVFRVAIGEPQEQEIPPELMDKTLKAEQVGKILGVDDFEENYWDYIDTQNDYSTDPDAEILHYSAEHR
jgi:outer membrane protein assembly factor BamE (lipoprotein component of BamABCDE complex)